MKKVLAAVLGAAMVVSSFALLAGCGESKIYIDGKFNKEASAEEIESLKTTVRGFSSSYAGDTSASDWSYGLHMITKGKNDMQMSMSVGENSMNLTANTDANIDMNFSMAKAGDKLDYAYGGKFDFNFNLSNFAESGQSQTAMKGNIYGNAADLYFDGSIDASFGQDSGINLSGKYKFGVDGVLGEAIDEALSTMLSGTTLEMESPAENVKSFIDEMFAFSGAKVYIDDSDAAETKVKFSIDGAAYLQSSFSGNSMITTDVVADIVSSMDFKTVDYYLSFNKTTGMVTGYGGVFDVELKDFSLNLGSEETMAFSMNMSMDVDYSSWVLLSDESVIAPDDISEYIAA